MGPPRLVIETVSEIAYPLPLLSHKSPNEWFIPQDWKQAIHTKMFRKILLKFPSSCMSNNRVPTSCTCFFCLPLRSRMWLSRKMWLYITFPRVLSSRWLTFHRLFTVNFVTVVSCTKNNSADYSLQVWWRSIQKLRKISTEAQPSPKVQQQAQM